MKTHALPAIVALILSALLIACTTVVIDGSVPLAPEQTPTPTAESSPTGEASRLTHPFTATIARGGSLTQVVLPDLVFKLIPYQEDWEIWVGNSTAADPLANYSAPVTPPFSGINARQIEGWHFRNAGNSGPNNAGEQNINAPQELRTFCFVRNQAGFERAQMALAAGLPALAEAVAKEEFPTYKGTLTISELTLGNLLPEQRAWIEQMTITVTLHLDQPCDLF
jgi:hypothetical protein